MEIMSASFEEEMQMASTGTLILVLSMFYLTLVCATIVCKDQDRLHSLCIRKSHLRYAFFSYFKMIYKLENSLVTAGKNEQHITKEV